MKVLHLYFFRKRDGISMIVEGKTGIHVVMRIGEKYFCSCLGFMFRKRCKHIEKLKKLEGDVNEKLE